MAIEVTVFSTRIIVSDGRVVADGGDGESNILANAGTTSLVASPAKIGSALQLKGILDSSTITATVVGNDLRLDQTATSDGDVTGPAGGVVDDEFTLFDGTTGKLIKGSGITLGTITTTQLLQRVGNVVRGLDISAIDHTVLTNIGTNSHAAIDVHIADATLHFTEASIDHTAILNIGTNTHAQIDTHIADATIHFTQAEVEFHKGTYEDMGGSSLVTSDFHGWEMDETGVRAIFGGTGAGILESGPLDKTDHPGVWRMTTGTTSEGRCFVIGNQTNGFHYGVLGIVRIGAWVRIDALGTGENRYVARVGSFGITLPNTINFGVGFEYTDDENGGRWQGITVDAGQSMLDTGITVAANTWYFLEHEMNTSGTSVEFFIDGSSVGTLSTAANIPNGTVIDNYFNCHILALIGTGQKTFRIDAYYLYQELGR